MKHICLLTLLVILINRLCAQVQVAIKPDENAKPTVAPPARNNKTRLVIYEYDYKSETTIFDKKLGLEKGVTQKIDAKYIFELLHHDLNGHVLARYQLMECISGPCDQPLPDVYVDFIQGGQNLRGVYIKLEEGQVPEWNMLTSLSLMIQTMAKSGAGDDQIVLTPYGHCAYNWRKPQDMHFIRKIHSCDFNMEQNHTLIDGVVKFNYDQEIHYRQNKKIDADIVFVEATEEFDLSSQLYDKLNLHVHSYTFLEMMNRTRRYMDRYCSAEIYAKECAESVFGATYIGRNWDEILKKISMSPVDQYMPFDLLVEKYRNNFYKKSEKTIHDEHSQLFRELVRAARRTSAEEIKATLKKPENAIISHVLAEVLGSVGTPENLHIAKEVYQQDNDVLSGYVNSLAYTTNLTNSLIKELKNWIIEEKSKNASTILPHLLFTTSTLLNRKCTVSISSMNACNTGKDQYPLWFINELTKCDNDEKCMKNAVDVFVNLPIRPTYDYATNFLCTKNMSSETQLAALKLMAKASPDFLDMNMIKKLVSIFRNVCPRPATPSESLLALDVLLKAVPEQQLVGSYLLRSETNTAENPEKWQYFYDSVNQQRRSSAKINEYWEHLRGFKVFRPNYHQRALTAFSNVHENIVHTGKDLSVDLLFKNVFTSDLLERSDFSASLKYPKTIDKSLFKLTFDTVEISAITDIEAENAETSNESSEPVKASIQLEILGHQYPPKPVFQGLGQLMSLVWNANGETFKAHESNIVYREFFGKVPLMSGFGLDLNFGGAISLKILGEAEISLWNRNSKTSMINNISISLDAFAQITTPQQRYESARTGLSLVGSIISDLKSEFATKPYLYCQNLNHNNVVFRYKYKQHDTDGKKTQSVKNKIQIPNQTLRPSHKVSQMCHIMEHEHSVQA